LRYSQSLGTKETLNAQWGWLCDHPGWAGKGGGDVAPMV